MLNVDGGIIKALVLQIQAGFRYRARLENEIKNETLENLKIVIKGMDFWIFLKNNLTKDASSYILINFIDFADKTFLEVQALPERNYLCKKY